MTTPIEKMAPRGIFGVPHGILSSPDEIIVFGIGLLAIIVGLAYDVFSDGSLDLGPMSMMAALGIPVSLTGSVLAPPIITNGWYIPIIVVVLFVAVGMAVARHQEGSEGR